MAFKSGQQRKFLFALDQDKQKGGSISPQKSAPVSLPTARPPQMTQPPQSFKLGNSSAPKFHPPIGASIKPTSNPSVIPSLPSLPKQPKFAKTKKFFKKSQGM